MRSSILSFVAFIATANIDAILLRKRVNRPTQISRSVLYDRDIGASTAARRATEDAPTAEPVMTAPEQPQPDAPILGDNQISLIHRKLGKEQKLPVEQRMSASRRLRWTNPLKSREEERAASNGIIVSGTATLVGAVAAEISNAGAVAAEVALIVSTLCSGPLLAAGFVAGVAYGRFKSKNITKFINSLERRRIYDDVIRDTIRDNFFNPTDAFNNKKQLEAQKAGLRAILARKELRNINNGVDDVVYGRMSDWKKMNRVTHLCEGEIEKRFLALQHGLKVVSTLEKTSPEDRPLAIVPTELFMLLEREGQEALKKETRIERNLELDELASAMQKEKEAALNIKDKARYLGAGYVEALGRKGLGKKHPIFQANVIRCMIADYLDIPLTDVLIKKMLLRKIVRQYDAAIQEEVERKSVEMQVEEHADPEEHAV